MNEKLKRRQAAAFFRREAAIDQRPVLLLVYEGKNSEPDYFTALIKPLRLLPIRIAHLPGQGMHISVAQRAVARRQAAEGGEDPELKAGDPIWCIFDADPKADQVSRFNEAVQLAERHNIRVAWSHQAFEYWLLLHLRDYQGEPMHRDLYHDALNDLLAPLGLGYEGHGGKNIGEALFKALLAPDPANAKSRRRLTLAYTRAKQLHEEKQRQTPGNFFEMESSTTIYQLVEDLLRRAFPHAPPQFSALVDKLANLS